MLSWIKSKWKAYKLREKAVLKKQIESLQIALEKEAVLHEIATKNYNNFMVESELRLRNLEATLQKERESRLLDRSSADSISDRLKKEVSKLQLDNRNLIDENNALKHHMGLA